MEKKTKKKNSKSIKLSVYFAILTSIFIVLATTVLAVFVLLSIKNLISEYENDVEKIRNSLSTMLYQSITLDAQKNDFEHTKNFIDLLKSESILAYTYIKDNTTDKTVMGREEARIEAEKIARSGNDVSIRNLSREIDNYTLYYGILSKKSYDIFMDKFVQLVPFILLLFALASILAGIFMSGLISTPLEKLSKAAKEIADGHFDIKIQNSNFSEINDLIESYNEMTDQLNELYSSLELKVQERTIALEAANYKLQETQAMMVHSEKMRSLGELVAGIAHEINNPVNFIHGNIMILQNYADDLLRLIDLYDENNINFPDDIKAKIESLKKEIDLDFLRGDIKDLIKSCVEGTQRTKNIVLDLKNFSRMEEMVLTQFDIPKEIDTTLNILNNKYKNRITVVKNYNPQTPKIEAYGGQLNQVFMNILDNAQDAMGESGTLTINVYPAGENVKIEFIDTGKGIPEENLKKVFDPFFTTKPVGKGTGLGMSISYRVINDHKGTILVDSVVGKGTKFTITLPVNHPTDDSLADKKDNGAKSNGTQV